ncbi:MAG: hypothetical protein CVV10_01540, partial [Gammaproteobacteria bacterium HGW-Gammaproteobacteria-14]
MRYILLGTVLSLLLACSDAPQLDASNGVRSDMSAVDPDAVKAHAAKILQPFKMQLMQALQSGMAEG